MDDHCCRNQRTSFYGGEAEGGRKKSRGRDTASCQCRIDTTVHIRNRCIQNGSCEGTTCHGGETEAGGHEGGGLNGGTDQCGVIQGRDREGRCRKAAPCERREEPVVHVRTRCVRNIRCQYITCGGGEADSGGERIASTQRRALKGEIVQMDPVKRGCGKGGIHHKTVRSKKMTCGGRKPEIRGIRCGCREEGGGVN